MQKSILFFVLLCSLFVKANIATVDTTSKVEYGKELLLKEEKFVKALQFFTKELIIATKNDDQTAKAEHIYCIAECLFQLKDLKALEEVLVVGESFMKKNKLTIWYNNLSLTKSKYLIDIGKEDEAIQLLQKLNIKSENSKFIIKQKLILADAYYRVGKLEECSVLYKQVLNKTRDTLQIAQAYNGIGSCFFMLSQFDSAKISYNKSLKLYSKILGNTHTKIAQVLYNLSLISLKYGDNISTEKYF